MAGDAKPHRAVVRAGTPASLWVGPRQHDMRRGDVRRAQRIIELKADGTYTVIKDSEKPPNFRPTEAVVFIYEEVN